MTRTGAGHGCRRRPRALLAAALLLSAAALLAAPPLGATETGVSPTRVSLPDGPGSIGGLGENVTVDRNMGVLVHRVPIALPAGHGGLTPELALVYGAGDFTEVGMGWSLPLPSIERMTVRGLPRYTPDDRFVADGGAAIVRTASDGHRHTYRARFEREFVRYTWFDAAGDGRGGYWTAERPDGEVAWYGARADGTPVPAARVAGADGVFRYHVVERRDPHGHRVVYTYEKAGGHALLAEVGWVFRAGVGGDEPRYRAVLDYEPRADQVVDGTSGVELRHDLRLAVITVLARGKQLRRYVLGYQPYEETGGFSRLGSVVWYGTDDAAPYPVAQRFGYTGAFGAGPRPYVEAMGGPDGSVDFAGGGADLVDIDGDGLPDVVDASRPGAPLRFHLNRYRGRGDHGFAAPVESAVADAGGWSFGLASVRSFDYDGDGLTDLVRLDPGAPRWLRNTGGGDYAPEAPLPMGDLPDPRFDDNLRFFDVDGDKRIDLVHSDHASTWYYRNTPGVGFVELLPDEAIGAGFVEDGADLADMNGDGLLDVVALTEGALPYRPNLGWGRFGPWTEMLGLPAVMPPGGEIADLDGDGLDDLVWVRGDAVHIAFNLNGLEFAPIEVVGPADVEGELPERTGTTTVLFADMNGNGSTDVVWADPTAPAGRRVRYLELFPERAHLLRTITNDIGQTTTVTYGSSAEELARDRDDPAVGAWATPLPLSAQVVTRIETTVAGDASPRVEEIAYHDGFYDGVERQFRGFGRVEVTRPGDAFVAPGREVTVHDVGAEDPYRKGLVLETWRESDGVVVDVVRHEHDDCALDPAEVPPDLGTPGDPDDPAVRFVCERATEREVREGAPESDWVTQRVERDHDAHGNVVRVADHGVVAVGGGACPPCDAPPLDRAEDAMGAPCGPSCLGDERYEESDFVAPGAGTDGRWITDRVWRLRTYGRPGSDVVAEETRYYDGPSFEGLPAGELTRGLVTRVTRTVEAGAPRVVTEARHRHDAHGNVVETLDALDRARRFAYDDDGLLVTAEEIVLAAAAPPATLRMEAAYDPVLDQPVAVTAWMRVVAGAASPRNETRWAYDAFGRVVAVAEPGDTLAAPTKVVDHDLGAPRSRIRQRTRSKAGGALDLAEVWCLDGAGREVQRLERVDGSAWLARGYTRHDAAGEAGRTYVAHASDGTCAAAAPADVPFTERHADATGRPLRLIHPDAAERGGVPSVRGTDYAPLVVRARDEEDGDPASPHADTPLVVTRDGLDRVVRVERFATPTRAVPLEIRYDELSNLRGYVDPAGHEKVQRYDLLGRLVVVDDPDIGVWQRTWDDAGQLVEVFDPSGVHWQVTYDEAGRAIAAWDRDRPDEFLVTYAYDTEPGCEAGFCVNAAGRLVGVTYPLGDGERGSDTLRYDRRGNLVGFARTLDGFTLGFGATYDNAGRLTGRLFPGDNEVAYELDGAGRVVAVPGYLPKVAWDERSRLARVVFANGVITDHRYDVRDRLLATTTRGPDGAVVQDETYTWDRVGNVVGVADERTDLAPDEPSRAAALDYDALYRLVEAELDAGRAPGETLSYAFDDLDRLVAKTSSRGAESPAHVGTLVYGEDGAGPRAVTRAGDVALTYTSTGKIRRRGGDDYAWDSRGLLAEAKRGEKVLGRYAYDADGVRVRKVEGDERTYWFTPDIELRGGRAVFYVRLGESRVVKVEEVDPAAYPTLPDLAPLADDGATAAPDGRVDAADAWVAYAAKKGLLDADVGAADPAALLAAAASSATVGARTQRRYLHHDHLGSLAAVTDEEGAVVERAAFYPYGVERTATAAAEPYAFTGMERDRGSGLVFFGARYLDPWLGRFLTPDPAYTTLAPETFDLEAGLVRREAGLGLYTFVNGSPVTLFDPDGLEAEAVAEAQESVPEGNTGQLKDYWEGVAKKERADAAAAERRPGREARSEERTAERRERQEDRREVASSAAEARGPTWQRATPRTPWQSATPSGRWKAAKPTGGGGGRTDTGRTRWTKAGVSDAARAKGRSERIEIGAHRRTRHDPSFRIFKATADLSRNGIRKGERQGALSSGLVGMGRE